MQEKITLNRLKQYQTQIIQKEMWENTLDVFSFVNAVDLSKTRVNSGKISDITADKAILLAEMKEYQMALRELKVIKKYLLEITDDEVKTMALLYCMKGYSFEQIGEMMHCNRRTVSRKLNKYIGEHQVIEI